MGNEELRRTILRKMLRRRCIGGKHIGSADLAKSTPMHLRGDLKDELGDLVRDGLVLSKPTHYGVRYSLNRKRLDEIRQEFGV